VVAVGADYDLAGDLAAVRQQHPVVPQATDRCVEAQVAAAVEERRDQVAHQQLLWIHHVLGAAGQRAVRDGETPAGEPKLAAVVPAALGEQPVGQPQPA
jgi:hypothetical protein